MRIISTLFLTLLSCMLVAQDDCLSNHSFTIVVLGSSTAAGSGASRPDSAWVNRYRNYLQSLNPDNEVVNLARGGYNSYRLMPDDFTPPPGRPAPDPARNITRAIAFEPDAIIVNLPSNDVAAGYGLEQLANFDTMVARANKANIPIWIATTQPRNFTNQLQIQLQLIVRDSIFIKYGDFALDFWTLLANSDNWIKPYYSSGDGVHLSDPGHRVLWREVVESQIPQYLIGNTASTDYFIKEIAPNEQMLCHDRPYTYEVVVSNLGKASTAPLQLEIASNIKGYGPGGRPLIEQVTMNGLGTCATDTMQVEFRANDRHNQIRWTLQNTEDTIAQNDTFLYEFNVYSAPQIFPQGKAPYCTEDDIEFKAISRGADPIFWYDNFQSTMPAATGERYEIQALTLPDTVWVETKRSTFKGSGSLSTPNTINKDWNGEMVELIAKKDLDLDRVHIPIASIGEQVISVYYKNGSHDGFSNDPGAWTFLKEDTLQVANAGIWMPINLGGFTLAAGDTLSLYFYLNDPSSELHYVDNGEAETFESEELLLQNSAGIGHTFGTIYSPRTFVGRVEYSYSFTHADGCVSERLPVPVDKRMLEIDADPLHIRCEPDSFELHATAFGGGVIRWYNYDDRFVAVGGGPNLSTGLVEETDTFFVQNNYQWLPDSNDLEITSVWNTAANGAMFDVVGTGSTSISNIQIRPAQTGQQSIFLYNKSGTSAPFHNDEAAWGIPDTFDVNISTVGELVTLPFEVSLSDDTTAFYVRMANANHQIFMHPLDQDVAHVGLKLENAGAMNAAFGTFQPQLGFAGNIGYSHIRPPYSCQTSLLPVIILISDSELEIGQDTVYMTTDSLVLHPTGAFDDYIWSDGTVADSLVLIRSELDPGFTLYILEAIDEYGCTRIDSVWVYSDQSTVTAVQNDSNLRIYPNPGNESFQIRFDSRQVQPVSLEIWDMTGRMVAKETVLENEKFNTSHLPDGVYVLKITTATEYYLKRWVKE